MKPAMLVKFVLGSSVGLMALMIAEPMVAFAVPSSIGQVIGRAQRRQVRSGACKDKIVGVTGNKFLILSFTSMSPRIAAQAGARPPQSLG